MAKQYKSIEEKIFVDSGVKGFLESSIQSFYGTAATLFRLPTTIRKLVNKQTLAQKGKFELFEDIDRENIGMHIGGSLGFLLPSLYIACQAGIEGDYIPSVILGATNLLSGAYELGRLKQSIADSEQMLSDIAITRYAEGKNIEIKDENDNIYEPIFTVKFRKA